MGVPIDKKELQLWAIGIKSAAGWICRWCSITDKAILEAHHIKSKRKFPELVLDPKNGESSCMFCHAREHYNKGELVEALLILFRLIKVLMTRARWP